MKSIQYFAGGRWGWELDSGRFTLFAPAITLVQASPGNFTLPSQYARIDDLILFRTGWWIFNTSIVSGTTVSTTVQAIHYWSISLLFTFICGIAGGILGAFIWWRFCRRISLPGYCPNCGYDLRASPDRCPECGRSVEAANIAKG